MNHNEIIEVFAALHRGLGSEFRVEQDEEKSTIIMTGCGSGGKLMKEGKYENTDRNPMNGGMCRNASTCGKEGLPYYCVHAPVMFDILPKEWGWGDKISNQYGRQYDDDGNLVNEPCSVTIYK